SCDLTTRYPRLHRPARHEDSWIPVRDHCSRRRRQRDHPGRALQVLHGRHRCDDVLAWIHQLKEPAMSTDRLIQRTCIIVGLLCLVGVARAQTPQPWDTNNLSWVATTTSFTHTSAAAGQNCYRVIATSAKGDSFPSNVACKTNTQPSGPPNPPT